MEFIIYQQGEAEGTETFTFRAQSGQGCFFSRAYRNEESCLAGIEAFIRKWRAESLEPESCVSEHEGVFSALIRNAEGQATAWSEPFKDKEALLNAIRTFQKEAEEEDFKISCRKLHEEEVPNGEYPSDFELDLSPASGARLRPLPDPGVYHLRFHFYWAEKQGQFYFLFHRPEEDPFVFSPSFPGRPHRKKGMADFLRFATNQEQWQLEETNGQYHFLLQTGQGQTLARTCNSNTPGTLKQELELFINEIPEWRALLQPQARNSGERPAEEIDNYAPNQVSTTTLTIKNSKPPPPPSSPEGPNAPPGNGGHEEAPNDPAVLPCAPLFKPQEPYEEEDIGIFFGRAQEVEEVYGITHDSRLILLYGEKGAGKTSLVRCGLANRFSKARWEGIFIRPGGDINEALSAALSREYLAAGGEPEEAADNTIGLLHQIHKLTFKPLFLVFDPLEELFEEPGSEAERTEFFNFLKRMLEETNLHCHAILAIQEEYLGRLSDYEHLVPTLLEHRYHLHPLDKAEMAPTVASMLRSLESREQITLEQPELVAEKIHRRLMEKKPQAGMGCLQVYLHQLHQDSCRETDGAPAVFSPALVDNAGPAEKVIGNYLKAQREQLKKQKPEGQNNPAFVAWEQKKEALNSVQQRCGPPLPKRPPVLLFASLGGLILAILGLFYLFSLLKCWNDPYCRAKDEDTCEGYMNFICSYGNSEPVRTAEFRVILDERQDRAGYEAWKAFKQAIFSADTCSSYEAYIEKYQNDGACRNILQQYVYKMCPDTVVEEIARIHRETIYLPPPTPPPPPPGLPDCTDLYGIPVKRFGPLWVMKEDLYDGQRFDWLGALNECRKKGHGWRLPCEGEMFFLLDKLYGGDSKNAYSNMVGFGDCFLINKNEYDLAQPNRYWTATESDDGHAWAVRFDHFSKEILFDYDTDKRTTLPCRCVRLVDELASTTGMKGCYEKELRRVD